MYLDYLSYLFLIIGKVWTKFNYYLNSFSHGIAILITIKSYIIFE
jgi:hypothetical protein